MKITVDIPKTMEDSVKKAFVAYSNINPDPTKNVGDNIASFVKEVFYGMELASKVVSETVASKEEIKAIDETLQTDKNKLLITIDTK